MAIELVRRPVFYAYGRVSTKEQELSPDAQEYEAKKYYETRWPNADTRPTWGGWYFDGGWSAGKYELGRRKSGQVLLSRALPGDHVFVVALDRLCRNFHEFLGLWSDWQKRGIFLHMLRPIPMDSSDSKFSIMHDMFMVNIAAFAQMERDMLIERVRVTIQERRRQGGWFGPNPPLGWRPSNKNGGKNCVRCDETEAIAREVAVMYVDRGMTTKEIFFDLIRRKIRLKRWQRRDVGANNRRTGPFVVTGTREISMDSITELIRIGMRLRESNDTVFVYGQDHQHDPQAKVNKRQRRWGLTKLKNERMAAESTIPSDLEGEAIIPEPPPTHLPPA